MTAFQCLLVSAEVRVPRAGAAASRAVAPTGLWTLERGRKPPGTLPQAVTASKHFFTPAHPSLEEAVWQFVGMSPRRALGTWLCTQHHLRCLAGTTVPSA